MPFVVRGIIHSAFGLLHRTDLRDYIAERLNEGDLTEEKCRQFAVREIDDFKSNLGDLSSWTWYANHHFFNGVNSLRISLDISGAESRHQPSTSKAHLQGKFKVEGATASRVEQFPVTQAERDALESVFELSEIIGNLRIASNERHESVKESFKTARKLATETFNNVALSIEDRLMASKLRIASRILEGLEDPEAAVHDCLRYLKQVQDLPAVQAMFSVWRDSDKGIISRLRARFNKEKVESIQMINALLIDFTIKFTNIKMGLLDWPTIKIGKDFYHPLLEHHVYALQRKFEEKKTQLPWYGWKFNECINDDVCALTSKGEILSRVRKDGKSIKLTRRSGEHELFCTIPWNIRCFAVDENDNVYIVVEIPPCSKNGPPRYKLLTLDSDSSVKADRFLDVIDENLIDTQMSVTKDGMIVIYGYTSRTMYICDSTNTRQDYKFPFPFKDTYPGKLYHYSFTVSNKNEIIFLFHNAGENRNNKHFLYIITIDGTLQRKVQVPVERNWGVFAVPSAVFNHVNETTLVSLHRRNLANIATTTIFYFSDTGKLLHQFDIRGEYRQLLSHRTNGRMLLVNKEETITLQM
jgi:hypothetical protein